MSRSRYRVASVLAVLAALVMAAPALAGEEHERARPVAATAGAGSVVLVRYFGYPLGFYPGWDTFWYPGPWGYGWPGPEPSYALQPAVPTDQVLVTLHIKPAKAEVTVDGRTLGKARDFDSVRKPLWLKPGGHVVEIGRGGYQTLRLALDLEGGRGYDLSYGLNKGAGVDGRSSEHTKTPGAVPAS